MGKPLVLDVGLSLDTRDGLIVVDRRNLQEDSIFEDLAELFTSRKSVGIVWTVRCYSSGGGACKIKFDDEGGGVVVVTR
eukprot:scaffold23255_cov59-Attheya_sp.AAC.4